MTEDKIKCECGLVFDSPEEYERHIQEVKHTERHSGEIVEDLIKAPDGQCCRIVANSIFGELEEIRNREITSPEEQDQQEIDYQKLKKKWCEKYG